MKRTLLGLSALLVLSSALAQSKELRIYTWGGYLKPEVVAQFEKKNGVKVKVDLFGSNEEMIAKLQAGGVSQYDLVVPTDYAVESMVALKLLMPLDKKLVPNLKNISATFANPAPDSWAVLFDSTKSVGKYLLMDSPREMMGPALKYLGHSVNTIDPQQVQAAGKLLLDSKKASNSLGFAADVALRNRVISGEAALSVGYSGDALSAMLENKNLGFTLPKEGTVVAVDTLAIPARAPNSALAHRFIDFIMDPKVNAENANFVRYGTPNQAALQFVNAADRKNPLIYPSAALLKKLESVKDLGKNNRLYDETWTAIKSR